MKKLILISCICLSWVFFTNAQVTKPAESKKSETIKQSEKFQPASDNAWIGINNTRYKLNDEHSLMASTDNKTWVPVSNGIWEDKDGKMLKVENKKLMESKDMGVIWTEVKDRMFKGYDNRTYMFDKNFDKVSVSRMEEMEKF